MFIHLILIAVGLAILVFGAEILVRGASSISKKLGIPSLVIGLTVVAFGTSAPELVVNLTSAFKGASDIAVGNIIGSNIANILLILGASALIINLKVQRSTVWKEIPFALLAVIAVLFVAADNFLDGSATNIISRSDGLVLLGFFAIFMYYTVALFKNGGADQEEIKIYPNHISIAMILIGLLALFFGGNLLVQEATALAKLAGLSDLLIGLTIVAVGTSLPEFATSIIAAKKGQADIAIGNVVGSNIFNVFFILGLTGTISPIPVAPAAFSSIIICVVVTTMLFFALFVGKKHTIEKWQGALFLALYVIYTVFLVYQG
jgi:cation:H+ antiporter